MAQTTLQLKDQLCHPLYSAANAILRSYAPLLKTLDLTYAQYVIMLSLWEHDRVSISRICADTLIDSGSMTPLLARLKAKKIITIAHDHDDHRQRVVALTRKGARLKAAAMALVPQLAACFTSLSMDEAMHLKRILGKLIIGLAPST